MKNLFKFLLVLVFIFTLFVIRYSSITVRASEDNPIPPRPIIPCDPTSVDDPEFDSLRPYQSHPCGTAPQSKFCGNKIIITESKTESKTFPATQGCDPTKQVNWVNDKDYWIDMTDLELPILGNTQDVQNSQNGDDKLDNSQKMNEYASWYLNGVINRAEYGDTNNTAAELINFSGPINKLMPSVILEAQRIETIKNPKDEENGPKESSSHNQIVVCGKETTFGLIGNLLDLGKTVPVECYLQSGDKYRLVDDKKPLSKNRSWEGDLSFWNSYVDSVVGFIVSFLPDIAEDVIRKSVLEHWNSRIPPLPWEKDPHTGEEPMTNLKYRKYYNEWKGKTCVVVPLINYLACFENIFVPNRYADLYPYVPLANTSDKHYPIPINTVTIQGSGSVDITSKSWDVLKDGLPLLYYPHAIEVKELSDFLNKTYLTGDPSENVDTKTSEINSYNPTDPEQCRIINVRSNEGDNLFPIGGDGEHDIGVHVYFEVDELPLVACIPFTDPISGEDKVRGKYYGEVAIEIHTDPVQVPNADQIWKSTVSSETSTFRRIFPKVEKGAPVECIADIPGVSKVAYTPIEGTDEIGVKSLTNPEVKYDPLEARLHFPHLGTVYEYFLKGIQTALRPKGYGTPIINGTLCDSNDIPCGELPDLPQASGSCALGGVSSKVGSIPPTFKEILEAAAETYKTPPNLILGVMYGEGAFNSAHGNSTGQGYDWTEENVLNWATCEPIPNCSGPETTVVGFVNTTVWDEIAQNIKDDLQNLDPNKTEPDPCNLLDVIYGISWTLSRSATGASAFTGHSCFGIPLNTGQSINTAGTCSWDARDYETAIRWWEYGPEYNSTYMCATFKNSCSTGGMSSNCPTGDDCETINNRYPGEESHNGCVWDVGHGL